MSEKDPELEKNPVKSCLKPHKGDPHNRKQNFKIGPLKVFIVDTRDQYCSTVSLSIIHALSQMMIGAVNAAALGYTILTRDIHVCLCTVAWHFCTIEAILAMNYSNGWASPMKMKHRKLVHMLLQVLGMICLICGVVIILTERGISKSFHGIFGLIGLIMTCITIPSGPAATIKNHYIKLFHVCIGLPTFIITSICLFLGFMGKHFQKWTGTAFAYVLLSFIAFYTLFIVVTNLIKCHMRIKYIRSS